MLLTFIVGATALAAPSIVELIAYPATWLLQDMTFIAQYLAQLPWAQTVFMPTGWLIAMYISALVAVCIYMQRKKEFYLRGVNIIE